MAKYLVVGGVAAGAAFAAKMRRLDEHAQIVVFEKGSYVSYANCGLPYYIGGVIKEEAELILHTPESLRERFNIEVLVNTEVVAINRKTKTVTAKNTALGTSEDYAYDKLMLAPGALPIRPKIEGLDLPGVFTIRDVADTVAIKKFIDEKKPKRAAVIGGGFIGLEMADNFHEAGLEVTLVEAANQVMSPFDYEMACVLHNHLKDKGVDLRLNSALKAIRQKGAMLELELGDAVAEAEIVLLGIGVRPNTELAAKAGLELGRTGGIKTNEYMQTSDSDIYAAGDAVEVIHKVTGQPVLVALAGNANKQARVAAKHIAGIDKKMGAVLGTSVAKIFDLTAACTGANEKQLRAAGMDYDKVYLHPGNHAGYYPSSYPISIKLLFSVPDGKVFGIQAIGKDGTEKRVDVVAAGIAAGFTVHDLGDLELAYAPPYSSTRDPVNYAGDIAANMLDKQVEQVGWEDCEDVINGRTFLIDARTPAEFKRGSAFNAVNIPLNDLRDRLSEIPKDQKVYVFCLSGLRSYVGVRILRQNGIDAVNLGGGYMSFSVIAKDKGWLGKN